MKSAHGFTLIETMVAIAILSIALSTPYFAVEKALMASYTARDQLIAAGLAQEGLEFVRAVRDANYIYDYQSSTQVNWLASMDGTVGIASFPSVGESGAANCLTYSCAVDVPNQSLQECQTAGVDDSTCSEKPLYLYNDQYIENSSYGVKSPFSRAVHITKVKDDDNVGWSTREVLVTVTVTWIDHGVSRSVQTQEFLDNWLQ